MFGSREVKKFGNQHIYKSHHIEYITEETEYLNRAFHMFFFQRGSTSKFDNRTLRRPSSLQTITAKC